MVIVHLSTRVEDPAGVLFRSAELLRGLITVPITVDVPVKSTGNLIVEF